MNDLENNQQIGKHFKGLNLTLFCDNLINLDNILNDFLDEIECKKIKLLVIEGINSLYLKKNQSLNKVCKTLAKFARKKEICIIVSAEISCKVVAKNKSKYLQLKHLEYLKLQSSYFDKILFLQRDEFFVNTKNEMEEKFYELYIAKNLGAYYDIIRIKHDNSLNWIYE
jgi:replicative DNA helicase